DEHSTALSTLRNLNVYTEAVLIQVVRGSSPGYGVFFRSLNPLSTVVGEKRRLPSWRKLV
ncbi:MAG: hypothetical protein NZ912_04715, partial [Ignisphaera sp.]|nr:hypothetical protein [Ignisphaera sp.]